MVLSHDLGALHMRSIRIAMPADFDANEKCAATQMIAIIYLIVDRIII